MGYPGGARGGVRQCGSSAVSGCSVSLVMRTSLTVTAGQEAPHGRDVSDAQVERMLPGQEDCCFFHVALKRETGSPIIKEKAGLVAS